MDTDRQGLADALTAAYLDYLVNTTRHDPLSPAYVDYVNRIRDMSGLAPCHARYRPGRDDGILCTLPAGEDHLHRARVTGTRTVVAW